MQNKNSISSNRHTTFWQIQKKEKSTIKQVLPLLNSGLVGNGEEYDEKSFQSAYDYFRNMFKKVTK